MSSAHPVRLAVALAVLGALGLVACQDETSLPVVSEMPDFLGADMVTMGGSHTITNAEGIRTVILDFDTMFQWNDSVNQALRGVDLTVFYEDGSERASVTSLRGVFNPELEELTAQGNVVLTLPDQDRSLETQELHYDPNADQLWSDSSFVMYEGTRTIPGRSFRSDLDFRNFRICGPRAASGDC